MMVTMLTWRDEAVLVAPEVREKVAPEVRENVPFALVSAYGLNAGFYKVQAVCQETNTVIQEWKQPFNI